jgi:hypothetical protein
VGSGAQLIDLLGAARRRGHLMLSSDQLRRQTPTDGSRCPREKDSHRELLSLAVLLIGL